MTVEVHPYQCRHLIMINAILSPPALIIFQSDFISSRSYPSRSATSLYEKSGLSSSQFDIFTKDRTAIVLGRCFCLEINTYTITPEDVAGSSGAATILGSIEGTH